MGNIDIARETYHQPATRHRRKHPVARALGLGLAGVFAIYLLGRGVAEFFVIHYSDPASYRNDWGGPSLAGVFAVHSGPGGGHRDRFRPLPAPTLAGAAPTRRVTGA